MFYLFIYNCYYSSLLAVLSKIKHWQCVNPFIERNAARFSVVPTSVHTLINLTCIDGIQYTWTDYSMVSALLLMKHGLLFTFIITILLAVIGIQVEEYLQKNDYEFPEWWKSVYDRIPFLIKLILFFCVIIGPFYILSILLTEYGYLHE